MRQHVLTVALGTAISVLFYLSAVAQEGYFGVGHDKFHSSFYDHLLRKDGSSCCNHVFCRPTQSGMVDDHYEVKVNGQWMLVRKDKILNVVAPDGGAHVCAADGIEADDVIYRVILPPES